MERRKSAKTEAYLTLKNKIKRRQSVLNKQFIVEKKSVETDTSYQLKQKVDDQFQRFTPVLQLVDPLVQVPRNHHYLLWFSVPLQCDTNAGKVNILFPFLFFFLSSTPEISWMPRQRNQFFCCLLSFLLSAIISQLNIIHV